MIQLNMVSVLSLAVLFIIASTTATAHELRPIRNLLGGYQEGDSEDARVIAAASFAVAAIAHGEAPSDAYTFMPVLAEFLVQGDAAVAELGTEMKVEITKVREQVVAGMNYDMTVEVYSGESCLGAFEVEVYDQFGSLEVTDWGQQVECSNNADENE